jgi:3-isopropylmalate/(R)-2-methylmalate dehydratase small subunit
MEKFTRLTGVAVPLMQPNIDTDAITPGRFLTMTMSAGKASFGASLFADWRFDANDKPRPDFVLNDPAYEGAVILVAGDNFGCGSSREHAVWGLAAYGIRCVIAPSFGEIFYNNCFVNGLLPIVLDGEHVQAIADQLSAGTGERTMTVDLEAQTIATPDGSAVPFDVDAARRETLLEGLDAIGMTLKLTDEIAAFQAQDRIKRPWIYL